MASHLWERRTVRPETLTLLRARFDLARRLGFDATESARYATQCVERHLQGGNDRPLPIRMPLENWERQLTKDVRKYMAERDGIALRKVPKTITEQYRLSAYEIGCDFDDSKAVATTIRKRLGNTGLAQARAATRYGWRYGLGVHASEQVYGRLTGKPLAGDDGGPCIDATLARLRAYGSPVALQAVQATDSVVRVLPALRWLAASVCTCGHTQRQHIAAWGRVTRGRDLFVSGLGPFDLAGVERFLAASRGRDRGAMLEPADISTVGYAIKWGLLGEGDKAVFRMAYYAGELSMLHLAELLGCDGLERNAEQGDRLHYLRTNLPFFREGRNREHIDVCCVAPIADIRAGILPTRLVALQAEPRRDRKPSGYSGPFNWLAEPAYPSIDLGQGYTLSVVRDSESLRLAAKGLHNCAASYATEVSKGQRLIAVATNKNGKRVAMGELRKGQNKWSQLSGPCNGPVGDTVPAEPLKALQKAAKQWAF